MKIYDISVTLEEKMGSYPSLGKFNLTWERHYEKGSDIALSIINMATHLGTHVDSPFHYLSDGKKVEDFGLERFYGNAQVVEVPRDFKTIGVEFLKTVDYKCNKILFKTSNSLLHKSKSFTDDYVYIEKDAAGYLVGRGIDLVGVDYVSPDKYKSRVTHLEFFKNNTIILENLVLSEVEEGVYVLICFPLKIKGSEGGPCRAVLIEQ